jgi:hypothetical protein
VYIVYIRERCYFSLVRTLKRAMITFFSNGTCIKGGLDV